MKLLLSIVTFVATVSLLVSCGEEIDTEKVIDATLATSLAVGESIEDMACDASSNGKFVYVSDSSEVYYCSDGAWIKLNGQDGTDGKDGKDGKDGTDGVDGIDGISGIDCSVITFDDGMSFVCGDTNKAAVELKSRVPDTCAITDESEIGFTITCGEKAVQQKAGQDAPAKNNCTIKDKGNGVVEFICPNDTVKVKSYGCGLESYDREKSFCYNGEVVDKCEGKAYNLDSLFCFENKLYPLCGRSQFDPTVSFCEKEHTYKLCGEKAYSVDTSFCYGNWVVDKCGDWWFDPQYEFCSGSKVKQRCGGLTYTDDEFCDEDGNIAKKCGGQQYNPKKQFCDKNNMLHGFCGGGDGEYDANKYFCGTDNALHEYCGGKSYDVSTSACCGGKVYRTSTYSCCNGTTYNPKQKTCINNKLFDLCDGDLVVTQEGGVCKTGGYYYDKGGYHYFVDSRDKEDYQYVIKGKLNVMVDFLKYNYKGIKTYCNTNDPQCLYGRAYTWAAAVDSIGIYKEKKISCGCMRQCNLQSPHRGICPEGWRLPTRADLAAISYLNLSAGEAKMGPGHLNAMLTNPTFCDHGCSRFWLLDEYGTASSDAAYFAYEWRNSSYYQAKHIANGVRCVQDIE